jgi:ABC-type amino acid transport substrate-binding protein
VLPDGSPNKEAVDAALRALGRDGTLADLAETWLGVADATEPSDLPVIRTQ